MMKIFATLLIYIATLSIASACSCLRDSTARWNRSNIVMLVQISDVSFAEEDYMTRVTCTKDTDDCVQRQVAHFKIVETFKRSGTLPTTIASGYGGGDCGIPLIAGAYYVVFLKHKNERIGFCNAAGPYLKDAFNDKTYQTVFARDVAAFIAALRLASKKPTIIPDMPRPIGIGSGI